MSSMMVDSNEERITDIPLPIRSSCEPSPPQYLSQFRVDHEPPSYEECQELKDPPPSYKSLFGRIRSNEKNSSRFTVFLKKFLIPFFAIIGCVLLFSVTLIIPILMIVIGALKKRECPAERNVPLFLFVGGFSSLGLNLLNFSMYLKEEEAGRTPMDRRLPFQPVFDLFLIGWIIAGSVWVYRIYEPNYTDHTSSKYCNYILYKFAFWLITFVILTVGFLLFSFCVRYIRKKLLQLLFIDAN